MAKDPAFLFYPGDASEDTQFLNRLERGCYFDLLKAQKKFGKFSLEQIKKVLGSDFESCWESIKICLTCVEDMYFIGWANDSIEKRKTFSESRRNNRIGKKQTNIPTHAEDMNNISTSHVKDVIDLSESQDKDMENENEIILLNKKEEVFDKVFLLPQQAEKLKMEFGVNYQKAIEILSNHKNASGQTYKSDYHAILGWVREKLTKDAKTGIKYQQKTESNGLVR